MLIRNDADGKSYLYDLLDVKEKEKVISATLSQSGVKPPKPSLASSITDAAENSKRKFSAEEAEETNGVRYFTEKCWKTMLAIGVAIIFLTGCGSIFSNDHTKAKQSG